MRQGLVKNNLWKKATMKNVTNQLPKVNFENHGRKKALQNVTETKK